MRVVTFASASPAWSTRAITRSHISMASGADRTSRTAFASPDSHAASSLGERDAGSHSSIARE